MSWERFAQRRVMAGRGAPGDKACRDAREALSRIADAVRVHAASAAAARARTTEVERDLVELGREQRQHPVVGAGAGALPPAWRVLDVHAHLENARVQVRASEAGVEAARKQEGSAQAQWRASQEAYGAAQEATKQVMAQKRASRDLVQQLEKLLEHEEGHRRHVRDNAEQARKEKTQAGRDQRNLERLRQAETKAVGFEETAATLKQSWTHWAAAHGCPEASAR